MSRRDMPQRYHLTEREQMVIIYLMLGFTNKEIANRINLSEYTVKEHLNGSCEKPSHHPNRPPCSHDFPDASRGHPECPF